MTLMGQLFGQAQDVVTVVELRAPALVVYAPWLIVLLVVALVPAFLGEAHFNAQSYSLDYARTPERRELDYVRQTGASVETAKEVKIFGLNGFLIDRYRALADELLRGQPRARDRGAPAGAACSPRIGTLGYYVAYAYIVWRTLHGEFTHRRPDLPRRLVPPAAQPARRAADRASRRSPARRSTSTTCSRSSRSEPEIVSPPNPRPFPTPIREGFVFEDVGFRYPGRRALGGART